MSLSKKDDTISLYIRHFPDHIATKAGSILIQTKHAKSGYPDFHMEEECLDAMKMLPEHRKVFIIWWIEVTNKFHCISLSELLKIIISENISPQTNHCGTGSGTPYYPIPRKFIKFIHAKAEKSDKLT